MRGRDLDGSVYIGRTAELIGLSVTLQTAWLGARAASLRLGGLRDSTDRYKWPCSWEGSDPLLKRALDYSAPTGA